MTGEIIRREVRSSVELQEVCLRTLKQCPGFERVNEIMKHRPSPGAARLAARALDPTSGRVIEIHTTQPGLQLYTGNKLNGSVAGRGGVIYRQSAGFAFEPQRPTIRHSRPLSCAREKSIPPSSATASWARG